MRCSAGWGWIGTSTSPGAPAHLPRVDTGETNGKLFVLRARTGFEAELLRGADRQDMPVLV